MICPKCDVKLAITHTFSGGRSGKTATGECPLCSRRYTVVSFILGEAGEDCKGAYAVAGAMRRGEGPAVTERSSSEPRPDPT